MLAFLVLLSLCIASFALNTRRVRPAHLLTAAVFGYLACTSRRHLALFSLLCAPGLCYNLAAVAGAAAKRCARCGRVYYCGAACQRAHWPEHKRSCGKP